MQLHSVCTLHEIRAAHDTMTSLRVILLPMLLSSFSMNSVRALFVHAALKRNIWGVLYFHLCAFTVSHVYIDGAALHRLHEYMICPFRGELVSTLSFPLHDSITPWWEMHCFYKR